MIKVNDDDVLVEGGILDVVLDLARAITAVHKATEESADKKFADEAVVLAGRIAEFAWGEHSDDEIDETLSLHVKELERIADECIERKKVNDK